MAMRCLFRSPCTVSTFWQLPSHVRADIYRQACTRSFTTTAARKTPVLESLGAATAATAPATLSELLCVAPLQVLQTLHLFMPWWAAIPTAAVLLRGFAGHYAGEKSHARVKLRSALQPMHDASIRMWRSIQSTARNHKPPHTMDPVETLERRYKTLVEEIARAWTSRKKYGAEYITPWSFVNLGMLVWTSEAVRLKTGAEGGLLRLMATPLERVLPGWQRETLTSTQPTVPLTESAQVMSLDELLDAVAESNVLSSPSELPSSAYDATTAVEGLSFCPDLTLPDPTGYLGNAFLVVMIGSMVLRPSRAYATTWLKSFTYLDGLLVLLAIAFRWIGTSIPAGVYLYLIASAVVGKASSIWINFKDPIPGPLQPCIRAPRR